MMYIPPLLLLVSEFAADYVEENNQLFDMICLRKYEELDNIVGVIFGINVIFGSYRTCSGFGFGIHGDSLGDGLSFGIHGNSFGNGNGLMCCFCM